MLSSVLGFAPGGVSQKLSGKWSTDAAGSYSERRTDLVYTGCRGQPSLTYGRILPLGLRGEVAEEDLRVF